LLGWSWFFPTTCKRVGHGLVDQQRTCLLLLDYAFCCIYVDDHGPLTLLSVNRRGVVVVVHVALLLLPMHGWMVLGGHHSNTGLDMAHYPAVGIYTVWTVGAVHFPLLSTLHIGLLIILWIMDNFNSQGTFFLMCKHSCINYSIKQIASN